VYQAFLAAGLSWVVGGNGFIQGKVSAGMRSWGENVQATIGYGPRGAVVTLRSECALPTQVIDWGKNRQNVERIVEALRPLAPVL